MDLILRVFPITVLEDVRTNRDIFETGKDVTELPENFDVKMLVDIFENCNKTC